MSYDICDMRFINLNSSNAVQNNGTFLSDVRFNFQSVFQEQDNIDYVTVGVLNAQIPVSFYTINYTNDTIRLIYGGNTYNIAITRGNYNGNSLITELVRQFSLVGFTMGIEISRITGIMTFTSLNSISFSFGSSSLYSILGFVNGVTYNSATSQIIAPYPLNLLGIKRLRINSSALSTNTYDSVTMGVSSNLASIPVNVASFGLIDYVNNSNAFPILSANNVTYIDIQIVDENNNLINFNGINWTITLQLNIFRKGTNNDNNMDNAKLIDVLNDIRDELAPETDTPVDNSENNDQSENMDATENSNPANFASDPELQLLLNN